MDGQASKTKRSCSNQKCNGLFFSRFGSKNNSVKGTAILPLSSMIKCGSEINLCDGNETQIVLNKGVFYISYSIDCTPSERCDYLCVNPIINTKIITADGLRQNIPINSGSTSASKSFLYKSSGKLLSFQAETNDVAELLDCSFAVTIIKLE